MMTNRISLTTVLLALTVFVQPAIAEVFPQTLQVAQQNSQTLESAWLDATGFTYFTWLRADDSGEIHSSSIYTSVAGNTLSIYNTYMSEPLGHFARCGGLGCDLEQGQLVATLEFASQNNGSFTVQRASQKASFLQGAQCRITESYLQVFECSSSQGPNAADLPSIFRFSPGT